MIDSMVISYIDPLSGAILLQMLAAGIIGGLAYFRRAFWNAARKVLRIKGTGEDTPR